MIGYRKILLVLGLLVFPLAAGASVHNNDLMCMQKLPQAVVVDDASRELNFGKSARIDAFWDYEKEEPGAGYVQSYQNGSCFVTVSLYTGDVGRLSNNKIKRELKAAITFRQHWQSSKRIKSFQFVEVGGQEDDLLNLLLLGNYQNRFLKIRAVCQDLPRMTDEKHKDMVVEMMETFTKNIVLELNDCFRKNP